MCKTLFRCKEDGTVEVHTWITEIPYDASGGIIRSVQGKLV